MNTFIDRHQHLITLLLQHEVDLIIIGGYSVIYHGYKRSTGDLDIWLKPDNLNKNKLILVLMELGFDPVSIKKIGSLDFTKHLVFSFWEEPEKVDFLTRINLVEYSEADAKKIIVDFEGFKVPFLHLDHLILSKMNTGRSQDMADVEMLQKIVKLKEE